MKSENSTSSTIDQHYISGNYWSERQDSDSTYKVDLLDSFLQKINLNLENISESSQLTISEVGCGQGAFLFPLVEFLTRKQIKFRATGYDIATQAIELAKSKNKYPEDTLCFAVGSNESIPSRQDIIFVMDVLEHVDNPFLFLESLQEKSKYLIIHLPIEQSFFHLLFNTPTSSYKTFKHIHFFSWETANILIQESSSSLVNYQFTPASKASLKLNGKWRVKCFRTLRYLLYQINPDLASILMGGSVLLLLKSNLSVSEKI